MTDACDACLRRSHAFAAEAGLKARSLPLECDAACVHSELFPKPLRDLPQPPAVLYATRLDLVARMDGPVAVVIGSRRPSEYGRSVAYAIGRGLGAAGVPVVSGLALGIDAIAHRGCLDGGGSTIAVLANGVDVAYPRTNRALYERIREQGSIVSEIPPGARPTRWLFPARNRIMAALGSVTVVVEAAERSGTLITADFAADLGRDVAAVPGQVTTSAAVGTNSLIRNGAALITSAQDVLDLLYGVGAREVPADPEPELGSHDALVLEAVKEGRGIDELGIPAAGVRVALARLERQGLLRRAPSGAYVPAG